MFHELLVNCFDSISSSGSYLEVEGFVDFTEATLAEQHEQQVALVEHGVVVEARLVLVVDALQLAYVQVALALQLLHLELQVTVLLLQRVLLQLQDLFGLVVLLEGQLAVEVLLEVLGAVEHRRVAVGGRLRLAVAGRGPFAAAARRGALVARLALAQQLALPVDVLAQRRQLLLPLGQLLSQ